MPLCPQITNTPVTVTQTGDFVVTSVVPLIADTPDGLANNFESIEILADGKTKVYRSATEPTGAEINDGDLWIDTDDGNKLYVRAGGVWTSAQDASIGTAQAAANAAAAAAATAQANATTALADAAIAYNAAVASLQPSANTIVNASNQITSISGNGINVFSGTGANSGPRVVLNSLGLAAYGTSSSFNITSASGNGTSVTYTATGHNFFVGQGVTVTELAPSGYNGSFIITAVAGSTFTVANTTTATVTDPNGFAIVSSVNVTNVSGNGTNVTYTASGHSFTVGQSVTVSGLAPSGYNGTFVITSVVASTSFTVANTTTAGVTDSNGSAERATFAISSTTGNAVFSGSITGSTIIGGTLNIAGNATINSSGLLTATGATITGTINAEAGYFGTASNGYSISATGLTGVGTGAITGGVIQTSSSGDAVVMSGTSNSLFFKYAGSVYGHMMANTSGSIMIHYGATATPAGTAYPQLFVGSTAVVLSQSVTRFATIDSNGLGVNGDLSVASGAFYTGTYETTSTAQTVGAYIPQSGSVIARRDNQIPIFAHRFNASGTAELIRLVYNGSDAGGIQTSSAGSPSFRSTSDYRLKNNIQDYTAGTNIIKNLRVRSYEMNNNPGKTEIGFIAHEYAETVPDMVNGAKDAIDADGNPEYQSISTTNLIPYLVGALKDAILRIESLEQGE